MEKTNYIQKIELIGNEYQIEYIIDKLVKKFKKQINVSHDEQHKITYISAIPLYNIKNTGKELDTTKYKYMINNDNSPENIYKNKYKNIYKNI